MKKIFICTLVVFLLVPFFNAATAQELAENNTKLTGILTIDSRNVAYANSGEKKAELNLKVPGKKNRWLAGLFSLILPGAGEYYAHSYLKGAIFTVVEAAAITTALIYNHKGDSQTNFFQNYANKNWDVSKYAAWTLNNLDNIPGAATVDPSKYHVFKDNIDWKTLGNNTDWSKLNSDVNWSELNRLESDLGGGYTHQLPYIGNQQYYELIGKYPQYSHGWATANFNDADYHTLTDQFLWYSHQRGVANEYYQTGATAVAFIYINHFLSVLDAIWTTDRYNNSIELKLRMERQNYSYNLQFVPTLHLSVNF